MRFGFIGAGVLTLAAWFVSIAVNASVGQATYAANASLGPIPTAPPALKPLMMPRSDPFAADVPASPTSRGGGASNIGNTVVPDVAMFSGGGNVGVVAAIASDLDAYALVEDGSAVRVAHVGDALGSSRIVSITADAVRLANGMSISVHPALGGASVSGLSATGAGGGALAPGRGIVGGSSALTGQPATINRLGAPLAPGQIRVGPPGAIPFGALGQGGTGQQNPFAPPIAKPDSGSLTIVSPSGGATNSPGSNTLFPATLPSPTMYNTFGGSKRDGASQA